MYGNADTNAARIGDWLEVSGPRGTPGRHGQIVDVLGGVGHRHFLVRWDEEHESIYYPQEGVTVLHAPRSGTEEKRS